VENTNVSHATFLAEASPQQQWNKKSESDQGIPDPAAQAEDEFNNVTPGKGTS
jgi:hypothetical protein